MGTRLLAVGVALLGRVAVRQPHGPPMPVHDLVHHARAPRRGGVMHRCFLAAEDQWYAFAPSMCSPVSSDATTVARRRADRSASRPASKRVSARRSIEVEPTLADAQAEQVEEGLLQPLLGQGLEGLQVHRNGLQARTEGRPRGARRSRRQHAAPASRANYGDTSVLTGSSTTVVALSPTSFAPALCCCRMSLQPRRVRTFKRSTDPRFAAKLNEVVSLYMAPPPRHRAVSA